MFNPQHCGLYFTDAHILEALRQREREPLKTAFAFLNTYWPDDPLQNMLLNALRYRFADDMGAGEQSANFLKNANFGGELPYRDALSTILLLAQGFELVRDLAAFSSDERGLWLSRFAEHVQRLNEPPHETAYVEHLWRAALNVGAGITLEREDLFQAGVEVYQQTVHDDIRPQGYMTMAVDDPLLKGDGQSLNRQLHAVKALVLTAEAASHAGVNLWDYNYRGVSVVTAATYAIYYYFYPETWRWDEGQAVEPTRALFREHGGFLEMLNRHSPLRETKRILDDLRPIFDPYGGGLTTLSHGVPVRRARFFGF